jgi:hypothetical protein
MRAEGDDPERCTLRLRRRRPDAGTRAQQRHGDHHD